MGPLISVIIPIYNVEDYLDECVQSVIHQTYKNLEIILVDDGSPDKCPQMCDNYAKLDNRIKVIHKKNGGLSDARNAGLEHVTGDFVCFIDSDDFIDVTMCEKMLEYQQESDSDIVSCMFSWYVDGDIQAYPWSSKGYKEKHTLFLHDYLINAVGRQLDNNVCNKLFKRNVVTETFLVGKINEDFLFFYYTTKAHPKATVVLTTKRLYNYRKRLGSICNDNYKLRIAELHNFHDVIIDATSWSDSIKFALEKQYVNDLYLMLMTFLDDETLRKELCADWYWVRGAFNRIDNDRIIHILCSNNLGVFLLKKSPWFYKRYCNAVVKIKKIIGSFKKA